MKGRLYTQHVNPKVAVSSAVQSRGQRVKEEFIQGSGFYEDETDMTLGQASIIVRKGLPPLTGVNQGTGR